MNELDKLLSHSFEEIKGSELIKTLLKLSKSYLNLPYTDCEKEHLKYYQKLKSIKPNTMEPEKINLLDKKYILRGNTKLYYNETHFNNDTLTDKIAESAIKKFPRLEGLFLNEKERAVLVAMKSAKESVSAAEDDLHGPTPEAPEVEVPEVEAPEAPEVSEPEPKAVVKPKKK